MPQKQNDDEQSHDKHSADAPMVGIFWLDSNGRVYGKGERLDEAETHGDFIICRHGHYECWSAIEGLSLEFAGRHYEDVDRGRVTYAVRQAKFIVFLPKEYQTPKKAKARAAVKAYFNLSSDHVVYDFNDEHYQRTEWR